MASDNLQECEVHHEKKAFARGIRGNFYMEKLTKRDVIKCIKKSSNQQTIDENMTKEERQELYHQNIIQIFSYEENDNHFHIKTECCDLDLHKYLTLRNLFFAPGYNIDRSQKAKLDILQQIGKGLKYLHNYNSPITHGNLRPQNVLIKQSTDKTITVRLSDFDFQRRIS